MFDGARVSLLPALSWGLLLTLSLPFFMGIAGCSSRGGILLPEPDEEAVHLLEEARDAELAGDASRAEACYRRAIDLAPLFVPAHRGLQNLLAGQCRRIELFESYGRRLGENPDHPVWLYLFGRLHLDADSRERFLREARRSSERFPYSHYGLGYNAEVRGDHEEALVHYQRAVARSSAEPLFLLRLGLTFQRLGRLPEAIVTFRRILDLDARHLEAHLGLALVHRDQEDDRRMFEELRKAVSLWPASARAHALIREMALQHGTQDELRKIVEVLERVEAGAPEPATLLLTLGRLYEKLGRPVESLLALRRAAGRFGSPAVLTVDLRRVLVALGRYREAWEAYAPKLPATMLEDPENEVASRYEHLRRSLLELDDAPGADELCELADALAGAGWLEEAASVYSRALLLDAVSVRATDGLARLRGHLRFVERLRRLILPVYREFLRSGRAPDLGDIIDEVEVAVRDELEMEEELELISYAPLGRMWLSSSAGESPLARQFAGYNQHLVIGQRIGGPPEISVVNMSSRRSRNRRTVLGETLEYREIVNAETRIPSFQVHSGLRLAGIALVDTVLLDLESIWAWSADALASAARWNDAPEPVKRSVALPAGSRDERRRVAEPLCLAERLLAEEGLGESSAESVFPFLLEHVRVHEAGHVLDARRYLPLSAHPFRALGLLLGQGFSSTGVEAHLEGNAEIVALADSQHPRVALALTLGNALGGDENSVHARGYRMALEEMVRRIDEDPESYPGIDRDLNILQQLHRLPGPAITELARALARERFNLPR